ncbi:hypothetical protein DV735_g605, partial [Chaetothyriales sp. CBS 134920]
MPSDIQVFVRFQNQCVFAGEELRCTITFKNTASLPEAQPTPLIRPWTGRSPSLNLLSPAEPRVAVSPQIVGRERAQRDGQISNPPTPLTPRPGDLDSQSRHRSQRSVSIISINSVSGPPSAGIPPRPLFGHRRTSTIQTADSFRRASLQQSLGLQVPNPTGRRSPIASTIPSTQVLESRQSTPDGLRPHTHPPLSGTIPPQSGRQLVRERSPRESTHLVSLPSRHVSQQSQVESERSSVDFYSLSNMSQETLMSEQPSVLSEKPRVQSTIIDRPQVQLDSYPQRKPQAANLLMGYTHLNATFTVDGSLVDQAQFEEVKQKGFLGGQAGGGVVGVKKARPKTGLLGRFNFNSIGASLNTLMAGDNMSSVKEMNQVTNSRAVPLLSTPQSLLFVDLRLEPGDEKSYSFSTTIPRGLPSSHKGKAIRISYNILVGVQGVPGSPDIHRVRQISVPVRVFSGVDSDGAILGHDLFQPQVVLKDESRTRSIDPSDPLQDEEQALAKQSGNCDEFLKYVDTLLDRHRRRQSSASTPEVFQSTADETSSPSAQAINRAILISSQPHVASDSRNNRFEISRNGLRVAIITIDRALHRLGETVTSVIDFSNGQLLCSSLHGTLETTEKVSPELAVRSAASIDRATRRIWASHSENVLCSKRSIFAPTIPATATPSFVTSGINLEWSLRFEFGIVKTHLNAAQNDYTSSKLTSYLNAAQNDYSYVHEWLQQNGSNSSSNVTSASFQTVVETAGEEGRDAHGLTAGRTKPAGRLRPAGKRVERALSIQSQPTGLTPASLESASREGRQLPMRTVSRQSSSTGTSFLESEEYVNDNDQTLRPSRPKSQSPQRASRLSADERCESEPEGTGRSPLLDPYAQGVDIDQGYHSAPSVRKSVNEEELVESLLQSLAVAAVRSFDSKNSSLDRSQEEASIRVIATPSPPLPPEVTPAMPTAFNIARSLAGARSLRRSSGASRYVAVESKATQADENPLPPTPRYKDSSTQTHETSPQPSGQSLNSKTSSTASKGTQTIDPSVSTRSRSSPIAAAVNTTAAALHPHKRLPPPPKTQRTRREIPAAAADTLLSDMRRTILTAKSQPSSKRPPTNATSTRLSRVIVNSEALTLIGIPHEAHADFVVVHRILSRQEIIHLAELTVEIREARSRGGGRGAESAAADERRWSQWGTDRYSIPWVGEDHG